MAKRAFVPRCLAAAVLIALPRLAWSFCHEMEVVSAPRVRRVAASPAAVEIRWFGHATFQITSSRGTRVLADPHSRHDLPWPDLEQHVVTTSHQHGAHNNVWMAKGNPVVLHGLTPSGESWRPIHTTVRDVSVYAVPAYHDKSQGLQRGKNAIFVFRVDDVCIAHLGDLGHSLTPAQLKLLGKIDVLLVPVAGGMFTITPEEAIAVTKQVNPKIAIPEHYWWEGAVDGFTAGFPRVRRLDGPILRVTKQQLPQPIEIVVMTWGRP
ncbi:MAG TPA: MBL fold metallo-hydrolase [candidate division Zixibacteria bacterium]|nr:MBL fold metallo-hydrolase [candidate division Zixibacteria bacterium]